MAPASTSFHGPSAADNVLRAERVRAEAREKVARELVRIEQILGEAATTKDAFEQHRLCRDAVDATDQLLTAASVDSQTRGKLEAWKQDRPALPQRRRLTGSALDCGGGG